MPLPTSSPGYDAKRGGHYASPVKFEANNSGGAATTPLSSSKPKDKERRHKKKHHHSSRKRSEAPLTWSEQLLQLAAVLLTAVAVYKLTLAGVRKLEDSRRPFCDGHQDPERDNCRPCPDNGLCLNGELRCIPGFRRQGAVCVPDKQIDRNAQILAEFVQNKVCRISGESLCRTDKTTWVPEHQLWDASKEEKMGLDSESMWFVREKAVQLVRDKLNIRIDEFGLKEFECPIKLAATYQPIGCRLRKGIRANIYGILLTSFIVVSVAVHILKNLRYRRLLTRAEELYMQVCEILEERAGGASGEIKWVVSSRLRDHLLLPSERKIPALWKEVEGLVQEDSRIDQYPKLVNGDSRVVWEWQGEGTLRTPTKDSKR
ncbi:hypothetical protein M758_4G026300 [Ceratodon purpureus]|uniref:Man1/Src1-like C-terminal domain-containing protein n=1 Tax=Ceratodon purpureus TaxID=3225 RepID=A0A8T0I4V9_CERPU|nr:hypothetical protein KC19_4G029700 [Ceratodon purpureus]KAG0617943.1 hypothetical protein M758_4G026300 [Ceratodon purpureus]